MYKVQTSNTFVYVTIMILQLVCTMTEMKIVLISILPIIARLVTTYYFVILFYLANLFWFVIVDTTVGDETSKEQTASETSSVSKDDAGKQEGTESNGECDSCTLCYDCYYYFWSTGNLVIVLFSYHDSNFTFVSAPINVFVSSIS